uniref:Immunoglobulin domain-containing protein n=1 Tax=Stegastes partitus TaxID=144197 RepID=A0A3B5AM28_9TELE
MMIVPLSRVTSAAGVLRVFGYEGREANVSCHYRRTHQSNKKYFCKNDCSRERDKITQTKEDKYSIYDDKDKQLFTVTISELTYMDAGKYWCGVSRFGRDIYTEVRLDVYFPSLTIEYSCRTDLLTVFFWLFYLHLACFYTLTFTFTALIYTSRWVTDATVLNNYSHKKFQTTLIY